VQFLRERRLPRSERAVKPDDHQHKLSGTALYVCPATCLGLNLLAAPFLLVGSDDEILTAIRQRQQRWGINRLVIREDAIDKLAPLLPRLHETTE
jgi:hypothetical protein